MLQNNKPTQEKRIVSRFEYAIMQVAQISDIESYRPITPEEESHAQRQKAEEFFKQIKTKP